ncbi:MAG: DUF3047 domain-containing protein, partial [Methylococcaceae bacterium]
MKKTLYFITLILSTQFALAETKTNIHVGQFSLGKLDNWENKTFSGSTNYKIIQLANTKVLKATSNTSASGLFKQQRIDLHNTPFLNWRWRIDNRLENLNEQTKSGDDYSARVYVVVDGGFAFWKTKAINYVWASSTAKGNIWPNAFAGNSAMMIAVRSNNDKIQTWYQEKRNVLQDLQD